jgi:acetylornithine deacetylase/succinyl-diaminopimelate desuccinylase-like protein
MSVNYGADFALYVRTATGPDVWTVVNDINRWGKRSNRSVSSFPVFKRNTAYTVPGSREVTYSVAGFLNDTDAGQTFLRTAERANANVNIRVVPTDASNNGFEQLVRVGSTSHDATPEGIQEYSFEFTAVADETAMATTGVIF